MVICTRALLALNCNQGNAIFTNSLLFFSTETYIQEGKKTYDEK